MQLACPATLRQNVLRSDVTRLTTHIKTSLSQIRLFTGLNVDSKSPNIAFQLVWQRCCKKTLYVFVARFTEPLSNSSSKCLLVTLLRFVLVFNL